MSRDRGGVMKIAIVVGLGADGPLKVLRHS
jgi:hypothetical protein